MSALPIGMVLRGEDGHAVVVEDGTSPVDGLLTLLEEEYGGERFSPDNPAIVEALSSVTVQVWRSCTKAWKESNYGPDDPDDDWWSPDGDGRRQITVAWFDGALWDLGEVAEAAETSALLTGGSTPNPTSATEQNAASRMDKIAAHVGDDVETYLPAGDVESTTTTTERSQP